MDKSLSQFAKIAKLNLVNRFLILLGIFIGTLAIGVLLIVKPTINTLETAISKETELKSTYLDKAKKASALPLYKQRLLEVEQVFSTLLKQLPDKSQMDVLLNDLNHVAVSNGLDVKLFKPEKGDPKEFYAEIPVTLEFVGTYNQFGIFSQNVAELSRLINLYNIEIKEVSGQTAGSKDPKATDAKDTKKKSNVKMLSFKTTAKTYRYLDEAEIKANKALLKGKGKGKGKETNKEKPSKETKK